MIFSVSGQDEMFADDMCFRDTGQMIQPRSAQVAFLPYAAASENLLIKSNQLFAVPSNDIRVRVAVHKPSPFAFSLIIRKNRYIGNKVFVMQKQLSSILYADQPSS